LAPARIQIKGTRMMDKKDTDSTGGLKYPSTEVSI